MLSCPPLCLQSQQEFYNLPVCVVCGSKSSPSDKLFAAPARGGTPLLVTEPCTRKRPLKRRGLASVWLQTQASEKEGGKGGHCLDLLSEGTNRARRNTCPGGAVYGRGSRRRSLRVFEWLLRRAPQRCGRECGGPRLKLKTTGADTPPLPPRGS